jgi:hypothetical protein
MRKSAKRYSITSRPTWIDESLPDILTLKSLGADQHTRTRPWMFRTHRDGASVVPSISLESVRASNTRGRTQDSEAMGKGSA